jgi:hypothetical protein
MHYFVYQFVNQPYRVQCTDNKCAKMLPGWTLYKIKNSNHFIDVI